MRTIKVRFQLLAAVQCWWCVLGGPCIPLDSLRRAQHVLLATGSSGDGDVQSMPGSAEAAEGQDWVSTKDHQEVVEAIPLPIRAAARLEDFAFPFWVDIVLPPAAFTGE